MAESERRRNTINVRFDDAAWHVIDQAAAFAGRSLSGEIQHRLTEYEMLRRFFDTEMTAREDEHKASTMGSLPATKPIPGDVIWL